MDPVIKLQKNVNLVNLLLIKEALNAEILESLIVYHNKETINANQFNSSFFKN